MITAAPPAPAPAPFVVPPPPEPAPIEPVAGRRRGPPAPPRRRRPRRRRREDLPASAVQYLEPLALDYPRLSKRLGETGV